MTRRRVAIACLTVLLSAGAQSAAPEAPKQPESIGVATMSEDGTIRLQLVARGSGAIGDAVLVYKPGDKMYEEVKKHIGGINPGEEKPVPPWPETP